MAKIDYQGIIIIQKKGAINNDEKKIAQEIIKLIERNGDDALNFIKEYGPVKDLDGLFQLKDYILNDDLTESLENIKQDNMSKNNNVKTELNNQNSDAPIDFEKFGSDLDQTPNMKLDPLTSEAAKVRDYNNPDLLRQQQNNTNQTQPTQTTYKPIAEDHSAFDRPASMDATNPEELPTGVIPDSPMGNTFDIPLGSGGTGGPVPPQFTSSGSGIPNNSFNSPPPQNNPLGSKQQPFNPGLQGADNKEQRIAAEQLTDAALGAYEKAHKLLQYLVEVPEDKLIEMELDGKIDLTITVPVSETQEVTLMQFVQSFNQQAKDQLQYSKSFNKEVREAMIRVFMKHGWGLTDEQWLVYKFGEDISTKLMIAFGLRKSINRSLEMFSKMYLAGKRAEAETEAKRESAEQNKTEPKTENPKTETRNSSNFADYEEIVN